MDLMISAALIELATSGNPVKLQKKIFWQIYLGFQEYLESGVDPIITR